MTAVRVVPPPPMTSPERCKGGNDSNAANSDVDACVRMESRIPATSVWKKKSA